MYDETKKRQAKAQEILEMYGLTKGPRVPSTRETEDIPSLSGDTVEERLRISHRERVRMTRGKGNVQGRKSGGGLSIVKIVECLATTVSLGVKAVVIIIIMWS